MFLNSSAKKRKHYAQGLFIFLKVNFTCRKKHHSPENHARSWLCVKGQSMLASWIKTGLSWDEQTEISPLNELNSLVPDWLTDLRQFCLVKRNVCCLFKWVSRQKRKKQQQTCKLAGRWHAQVGSPPEECSLCFRCRSLQWNHRTCCEIGTWILWQPGSGDGSCW